MSEAATSNGVLEDVLPVGTRIRFMRDLIEPACGDHPAMLFAERGGIGEITGHGCYEGYWVKWDKHPAPFGAGRDEFEPMSSNAELKGSESKV
jgi:hypothetical protein